MDIPVCITSCCNSGSLRPSNGRQTNHVRWKLNISSCCQQKEQCNTLHMYLIILGFSQIDGLRNVLNIAAKHIWEVKISEIQYLECLFVYEGKGLRTLYKKESTLRILYTNAILIVFRHVSSTLCFCMLLSYNM